MMYPQATVTYPGRPGAHSAAAAEALFPAARLLPGASFSAVTASVESAGVDYGVLPIESSLSGAVAETHDLLWAGALSIVGETVLPIRHCLASPADTPLDRLRVIRSHPAALDQCRRLIAGLPGVTVVAAATTADAASEVAERGDPEEAAIASESAAQLHGLTVLRDDVGDGPAFTRFVSVARYTRLERESGAAYRIAFSFVTDHRPGALHHAIEPLARGGLDLVQLVSRPLADSPWRYRFDAVLAGHPLDAHVRETLAEVRTRTRALRVLGAYLAAASVEIGEGLAAS
jgi:prephenate dehydratase